MILPGQTPWQGMESEQKGENGEGKDAEGRGEEGGKEEEEEEEEQEEEEEEGEEQEEEEEEEGEEEEEEEEREEEGDEALEGECDDRRPENASERSNRGTAGPSTCYSLGRGSHPLGIQPSGNILFRDQGSVGPSGPVPPRVLRESSLGSLSWLPDSFLLEGVLSRVGPRELGRLCCCSQYLRAFAMHEELWRVLALEAGGEEMLGEFQGTWRDTFLLSLQTGAGREGDREEGGDTQGSTGLASEALPAKKQKGPLQVRGVFSDFLFQPWLCASLDLHADWLRTETIPRCSARDLSLEDFIARFERPNRPVILTDCMDSWPALELWVRAYLERTCGTHPMACGPVKMALGQFFLYAERQQEERPLYVFDSKFVESAPQLGMDYEVPKYFREDLFALLEGEGQGGEANRSGASEVPPTAGTTGPGLNGHSSSLAQTPVSPPIAKRQGGRPDFRWLIIGPSRSGSSWHIDPNSTSAWNAVVSGAKKWVLMPPGSPPPGVHPSASGADVASPVSLPEWFMNFYPQVTRGQGGGVEGVCRKGEVMFVPNGWWHCVFNLEESVAITQNYVSSSNLLNVLRFLDRPNAAELVSGTGERVSLFRRFKERLDHARPGLVEFLELEKQRARNKRKGASIWDSAPDKVSGGFKFGFS